MHERIRKYPIFPSWHWQALKQSPLRMPPIITKDVSGCMWTSPAATSTPCKSYTVAQILPSNHKTLQLKKRPLVWQWSPAERSTVRGPSTVLGHADDKGSNTFTEVSLKKENIHKRKPWPRGTSEGAHRRYTYRAGVRSQGWRGRPSRLKWA